MKPPRPPRTVPGTEPDFFSPQVSHARRFYLELNPSRGAALVIVCGGVEHTAEGYAIERSDFPFYSIEYVARGHGRLHLRGSEHRLEAGCLFSYGPGVPHQIEADPRGSMVKYFVDFAGRGARGLLSGCGLAPGQAARVFPPNSLEGVFEELIRCGRRAGRHSGRACVKLLECLALEIADAQAPAAGPGRLAFATFHQARARVERDFHRLHTLEEISAACGVNNAYLCRLFRRFDHQSPYQFLLRLKMNAAAERLQQPGALVKQVAELSGFEDPFHFSRAFKRVLGLSPDAFRKLR